MSFFAACYLGVAKSSTSFGWGKGGKVTATRWQITLCDSIWHVISHSSKVPSQTALCVPLPLHLFISCLYMHNWSCFVSDIEILTEHCILTVSFTPYKVSYLHNERYRCRRYFRVKMLISTHL